ncbi:MAG TPA: TonB-dependent receptor plug domain-containing protein, partial [Planctomycetota bacterium]|nr:TonB-dependent receptor plug domain-containing protein [Planctomycetota bacterium]
MLLLILAALPPQGLRAQDPPAQPEPPRKIQPEDLPDDLSRLSLEELMQIEVTTLSKRSERMFRTPAAVYVITSEEIRRSGLRSVAELLRLVPGVEVAHYDANKWAISARGFNSRFSNKLQVLIDGRSVYTPTFSGVLWDTTSLDVDDIERIEVIRGPGATVWGANAVNGVINIITKRAPKESATRLDASGGTEGEYRGQVHLGGTVGESARFRATINALQHNGFVNGSNDDADDDWAFVRGDFRLDWTPSERDTLLISMGGYDGESDSLLILPTISPIGAVMSAETTEVHGGYALARWTRDLGGG